MWVHSAWRGGRRCRRWPTSWTARPHRCTGYASATRTRRPGCASCSTSSSVGAGTAPAPGTTSARHGAPGMIRRGSAPAMRLWPGQVSACCRRSPPPARGVRSGRSAAGRSAALADPERVSPSRLAELAPPGGRHPAHLGVPGPERLAAHPRAAHRRPAPRPRRDHGADRPPARLAGPARPHAAAPSRLSTQKETTMTIGTARDPIAGQPDRAADGAAAGSPARWRTRARRR